jgi:hypothetical protein
MLDDSSPNCVDGTDSSPWFTLKKIRASGVWASEAWMTGVPELQNESGRTRDVKMRSLNIYILYYIYSILYIYIIYIILYILYYIYMRGAHSKAVLSGWANSTKMSSWSAFSVSQIWLLDLSVCYVCCFFIIMHGGVDELFFPQLLIPGPSRWFAVLDCTTCYRDKLLVSELLWFSQTWKSATLKSYEIDPIWTS